LRFKESIYRFTQHPWMVAAGNIALIMVLYTLSRLVFYYTNLSMFPSVSEAHLREMLWGGVRFDLTAVLYMSSGYLLMMLLPLPDRWRTGHRYQTAAKWVLLVPNILGLVINTIDMVYVRFTDRRTSMTFFTEFSHDDNLLRIVGQGIVQYWYVTLTGIALIGLLIYCTRRCSASTTSHRWPHYVHESMLLLVSAYLTVIGIRGGFGAYTRPITMSNALQYTNTPREAMIVLNTPFSLMRSSDSKTYVNPHYYTEDELERIYTPIHPAEDKKPIRKNVVILILESFSKEYIGYFNHDLDDGTYRGYTPFLDSLLSHSITYEHSFASGRKSIDAMPSVLSSIPMLIEPYIVTPYSTNDISSVAACLKQMGYSTAFFHGAPNGSMGFEAYARAAGFEHYYGMDEYILHTGRHNDYDGTWAIWDEDFLQYYARWMNRMQEPFMTTVFTASSHHPFRVPERYEGRFEPGTLPIHQCIGYTDMALSRFFAYASQQPWYEHTLFVLTADHTNEVTHPEYATAKGIYEVPIAFFTPNGSPNARLYDSTPVSQTDIMPSVLAYVGYDQPYFAFGEDILVNHKMHPYAVCYNSGWYQVFSDSLLVQYDGTNVVGLYNYERDPMLQQRIESTAESEDIVRYLKAFIQQYIERMTDNRLTAD